MRRAWQLLQECSVAKPKVLIFTFRLNNVVEIYVSFVKSNICFHSLYSEFHIELSGTSDGNSVGRFLLFYLFWMILC